MLSHNVRFQYDHLSNLAFTTGGLFVPQKYGPNDLAEVKKLLSGVCYSQSSEIFPEGRGREHLEKRLLTW